MFPNLSSTKKIILVVAILAVLAFAYYAISPLFRNIEVQDEAPVFNEDDGELAPEELTDMEEPEMASGEAHVEPVVPGPFPVMGTTGHPASGSVRVFQTDTETIIRYENFETINGPNLHVYLSKDIDGKEFLDLGPLKGTRGNINYTIPEGIDLSEYNYILTWCVPFAVLFNYAPIN